MNHTISVIMPNYNHAEYIPVAIEAILSQKFRPKEFIIIDDASTDLSIAVIEKYVARDPIVHLYRNKRNRGVMYNLNQGMEIATGDYLHFAAADDKVLPDLYGKSMRILSQYPQAGMSCTNGLTYYPEFGITTQGRWRFRDIWALSDTARYFSPAEFAERLQLYKEFFTFPTFTTLFERTSIAEAGGHVEDLKWCGDWFAAYVVAFRHGFCYLPECLGMFRMHNKSYHKTGMSRRREHYNVVAKTLFLLESPQYQDVREKFKGPAVLSAFGPYILAAVRNRHYWSYASFALVKQVIRRTIKYILNSFLMQLYLRFAPRIGNRFCQNRKVETCRY